VTGSNVRFPPKQEIGSPSHQHYPSNMRLPIRNKTSENLTLCIEPLFVEYQIPAGGKAEVTLDDGEAHSIDYFGDGWVTVWNEGISPAVVEIFATD